MGYSIPDFVFAVKDSTSPPAKLPPSSNAKQGPVRDTKQSDTPKPSEQNDWNNEEWTAEVNYVFSLLHESLGFGVISSIVHDFFTLLAIIDHLFSFNRSRCFDFCLTSSWNESYHFSLCGRKSKSSHFFTRC